jgi:hypothetical protein
MCVKNKLEELWQLACQQGNFHVFRKSITAESRIKTNSQGSVGIFCMIEKCFSGLPDMNEIAL